MIGIKDPLRKDVFKAVEDCHHAGIIVRMVTGDNVTTARAIAKECGIVTNDDDLVIEGPVFRKMTPKQVDAILPRLKVGHSQALSCAASAPVSLRFRCCSVVY